MKEENIYQQLFNQISPETHRYVEKNLDIMAEISRIMAEKGLTQKDLAEKMGKQESQISKWLTGLHNLTLKSIAQLEVALDGVLLEVPKATQQEPLPATYTKESYYPLTVKSSSPHQDVWRASLNMGRFVQNNQQPSELEQTNMVA